jgi:hypothetical protein
MADRNGVLLSIEEVVSSTAENDLVADALHPVFSEIRGDVMRGAWSSTREFLIGDGEHILEVQWHHQYGPRFRHYEVGSEPTEWSN